MKLLVTRLTIIWEGSVHESVGTIGESGIGVREYRLERLRLYNNTPKRKGSKIEYIRKRRALLADTLSQESIAMESPTYTPEVVHPTTDAIEPNGSALTPLRLGYP